MKLDIEKAFKAPFYTSSAESIKSILLKAVLISIGSFIVIFAVYFFVFMLFAIAAPNLNSSGSEVIAVILGILLFLLIFILFFAFLALPLGYVNETIKYELLGNERIMPTWIGNYGRFFVNGIKVQLIFFIYSFIVVMIPMAILGAIFALIATVSHVNSSDDSLMMLIIIPLMLIYLLIMIVWSVIIPFAWVRFADTGRILSAFNIAAIITKIFSNFIEFIVAFFITIAAFFLTYFVALVLTICTCYLGSFLMPFLYWFLLPIIFLNLFTQVYKHS